MDKNSIELEKIIEAAAKKAAEDILTRIGIDITNPIKAQGDFQALRELRDMFSNAEFEKDLSHLRKWRMAMDEVKSKSVLTTIGLLAAGFGAIILLGFRKWFEGS